MPDLQTKQTRKQNKYRVGNERKEKGKGVDFELTDSAIVSKYISFGSQSQK